ncbi:uncharacterized protein LOC123880090 isoform X2 [Maniola jurtina]|uniref:uncharacterized protein LOC123880090 isoform X2 n=1 Tax=Maniola jurtina TaxID=191418 RepID=UPI001E687076|nr:uncharacterized protein LOC123880090 isoform X2 [Maniola jurtina]
MNVYFITVTFLYVVSDFVVLLQSTKDDQHKPSTSIATNDFASAMDKWELNPDLKLLWLYRPPSVQSQLPNEELTHRVVLRPPHVITKLAKPWYGFDPFFRKPYFEPFERRQKPVTLVGFRKNGILPGKAADTSVPLSSEVAELQSSFNDISNFWQDDTQLFNL